MLRRRILTSYIVGNTDRFAAASANCPIVNWLSAMGTSDAITYTRTFEKPFWEDASEWIDRSSIFYVGNVTTPTMLMTGEKNLRTPMGQTEEYYRAPIRRRVDRHGPIQGGVARYDVEAVKLHAHPALLAQVVREMGYPRRTV